VGIDFEHIRKDNIRKHGEDRALFDIVSELMYSDRTHFVYELLQNAEDAGARFIEYHLYEDRLEIEHDGRPFSEADVRGICGVQSTKRTDFTAIGRFGIGFKSVHAFTETPKVHCGELHFRIEHYVRPYEEEPLDLDGGLTRFVLPFNKPEVAEAECFTEIERGLDNLHDYSLLFLSSVKRIRYVDHVHDAEMVHERRSRTDGGFRRVSIRLSSWDREPEDHNWWIWGRDLAEIGIPGRLVEFAVRVDREDEKQKYLPVQLVDPPLVVFFPTEKPSHLGMLLQGPFRTTPARDNIPERDETNQAIVGEGAELLTQTLIELRDRGLLTSAFLESLPLDPDHFEDSPLLRPLHDAVVTAFKEHPLVPTLEPGHTTSVRAALGRTAGVRQLLDDEQLSQLLDRPAEWITPDLDDGFRSFLEDVLDVPELTPELVVGRLDEQFLERQPDEWICQLYEFMHGQRNLYERSRWGSGGIAMRRPIIRLSDGTHCLPLDDDDHPVAYLPTNRPSNLPQLRATTVCSDEARELLGKLGLREPDLVGELCEFTIPSYKGSSFKDLDVHAHVEDMRTILEAVTSRAAGSERVRELLMQVPVIVGVGAVSGRRRLCTLQELMIRNEETHLLLGDDPEVRFVDSELYGELVQDMHVLGIKHEVRPSHREADHRGNVVVRSEWGDHCRGLNRFDPDASCDDLAHALEHPTWERAIWIWDNIALPYRFAITGNVETCGRQSYDDSTISTGVSPLGALLRSSAWLPAGAGFAKPATLELEELPPEFARSSELGEALGMKAGLLREFSRQTSIPTDVLEGLDELKDDPELLDEVRALLRRRSRSDAESNSEDEGADHAEAPFDAARYAVEFKEAFDRSGHAPAQILHEHDAPTGEVLNPSLRRERAAQEVEEDRANEPGATERFRPIPRRVWERKKDSPRESLRELYGGTCQICSNSFPKADGTPYFEGLYLVSYTRAAWLDQLGNVLSLCPTCSAKFQFSEVQADDALRRVRSFQLRAEGGDGDLTVPLVLAGEHVTLTFKERHVVALQALLAPTDENSDD